MTFTQLKNVFGKYCMVQFKDPWTATQFHQTMPDGTHLPRPAVLELKDAEGKTHQELLGNIRVIGPAILGPLPDPDVESGGIINSGGIVITHPGSDGSTLQTLCDADSILFVNLVAAPPPKSAQPGIILAP